MRRRSYKDFKNVLIANPFGIGDVLFSVPLLKNIRALYPRAHIAYLCNARTAELLRHCAMIDEVMVFEKDDYRKLWAADKKAACRKFFDFFLLVRAKRFDAAFDLSLSRQYGFLLKAAGIPVRIGYDFKRRGIFLTHKKAIAGYAHSHMASYYCALLALIDMPCAHYDGRVTFTDSWPSGEQRFLKGHEGSLLVGIAPGGGITWGANASYKQWGRENFGEIARYVHTRYKAGIVLLGDEKDALLCEKIAQDLGAPCINACGKASLEETAALLKKMRILVANDSGIVHLAAALGVKTISIFGPVDEKVYGPYYGDATPCAVITAAVPCRPCYARFKFVPCGHRSCLEEIRVHDVAHAIDQVLAS
jgi:lipopolysaccharide heptosyltransferase II